MEAAKAAIQKHLGSSGKQTTTHHEVVNKGVTHELVKPRHHENVTTVVDREVHQDHYNFTLQPIEDSQVLPEKHVHNLAPVQHVQREHDDQELNARVLQTEAAKYKDERVIADTVNTQSIAPTVGGEHVHHHVREIFQPVLNRTVIQPEIKHTVIPVHEVHHNVSKHHGSITLPPMTLEEYKAAGRTLNGTSTERTELFQGEPGSIAALEPIFGRDSVSKEQYARNTDGEGAVSRTLDNMNSKPSVSDKDPAAGNMQSMSTVSSSSSSPTSDKGNNVQFKGRKDSLTGTGTKKPSLLDRLNPRIDADGDGKAGFLK